MDTSNGDGEKPALADDNSLVEDEGVERVSGLCSYLGRSEN